MLVQRSFQPPAVPTLRIDNRYVVLARARHLIARLLQGGDHAGPVLRQAALDALHQVLLDHVTGIGLALGPGPQLRRLDVGAMPRLLHPRTRRIVRTAPGVLEVAGVHQRAIRLLPAGRRDVQARARLQVTPRRDHMHVNPAPRLAVPHRRPRVAVRRQTGPGRVLELVEHPVDLPVARLVLRRPGDHRRRVLVLELERVGHRRHVVRGAAQHRHIVPLGACQHADRDRHPLPCRPPGCAAVSTDSERRKPLTSPPGCDGWLQQGLKQEFPDVEANNCPGTWPRQSRRPRPTTPWNPTRRNRL